MEKKNMKQELDKQLHEQFAINSNTNLATTITLVVCLLGVMGLYGIVYMGLDWENDVSFDLPDLVFMTCVTFCAITLIAISCMEVGFTQRSNQFNIHLIRKQYYSEDEYNERFLSGYNPLDKGWLSFIPGLLGEMVKACAVGYIVPLFFSWWKIYYKGCVGQLELIMVCGVLNVTIFVWYYVRKYAKYQVMNIECKKKLNQN